jgi:nitrogen regulatory protein P-II 1
MKKIETLIKRSNRSSVMNKLKKIDCIIMDIQNLDDTEQTPKIQQNGKKNLKNHHIPLSKLEVVVSEKYFKKICQIIIKYSGLSIEIQRKGMFVTNVEIFGKQGNLKQENISNVLSKDKRQFAGKPLSKRNRMVSLQQITALTTSEIYEKYKGKLKSEYKIKSFSGFIDYCINGHLTTIEQQIKCNHMTIENQIRK